MTQCSDILTEAHSIIYGEREATYGDPGKNLRCIGELWQTYLRHKYKADFPLDVNDVCAMMRLLKEARLINTPTHRDSLTDICGYTALQERVHNADKTGVQEGHPEPEQPGPSAGGNP